MLAPMADTSKARGMGTFFTIWFGQLISLIGSQLTGFALGVWVYEETHSVLLVALTQIAFAAPFILLSPLAGVLVDRWNRRTAMIVSDFGAGLVVLGAAALYLSGRLQPWMVLPINFAMSSFTSLMWPAYTASISLLVPKEQYGRANGFVQLGEALPQIAGPALAGALYVTIQVGRLALIDFATYVFSVMLMLFFVRIPNPPRSLAGQKASGSVWREMRFGWDYIMERKGLLALLVFFFALNFVDGIMMPLFTPLILDTWKADVLGYVSMIMGVGMLAGTLVMSAWGGGKRKVYTLLGAGLLGALFLVGVGLRASIPLLAFCGFGFMFSVPIMAAASQSIWQAKVAPDVQGRVFSLRRTIGWSGQLVAPLLAAPLLDYVFRPAMSPGGALAPTLGPLLGVGASRGVGVLISLLGVLDAVIMIVAFASPTIRHVETDLPDHADVVESLAPGANTQPLQPENVGT
jgi:DHA3 family macrolide efflux protein-like MFS transporter